jgi:hypothetical protein
MPSASANLCLPHTLIKHRLSLAIAALLLTVTLGMTTASANGIASNVADAGAASAAAETLLLEIRVLGRDLDGIFEVERRPDGLLLVPQEAWAQARLVPAGAVHTLAGGQSGYALNAVPGVIYQIDRSRLILDISAPAEAFDTTQMSLAAGRAPAPGSALPGVYLDYDLSATHAYGDTRIGALLESVVFRHDSALVVGAAFRSSSHATELIRTDTYWRKTIRKACRRWWSVTRSAAAACGASQSVSAACAFPRLQFGSGLCQLSNAVDLRRSGVALDRRCADQQPLQYLGRGPHRRVRAQQRTHRDRCR